MFISLPTSRLRSEVSKTLGYIILALTFGNIASDLRNIFSYKWIVSFSLTIE